MVASTNSEQDNSDLVRKLDLEGHFTYGSSPLNADLLSELSKNRGFKLTALNITSIPGHIEELRIYVNSDCIDSGAPARAKRAWDRAPYPWNTVNLFSFGCHVIDRAYVRTYVHTYVRTRLQIVWVG